MPSTSSCFCPHCGSTLADWVPERAAVCPHCRLVIGAGRALLRGIEDQRSGVGTAAAAMTMRGQLGEGVARDKDAVIASLRQAAREIGVAVGELRMVHYHARAQLPSAGLIATEDVVATFGGWKGARDAASSAARRERLALDSDG